MFQDVELAREELASYKVMLSNQNRQSHVDFGANVLSASAWPTYPDVTVQVPREIREAEASFESIYVQKHSGRKLTWKQALAHCQMHARFSKGSKLLVVSGFQAIVLLCFNDSQDPQSYDDLAAVTNLGE